MDISEHDLKKIRHKIKLIQKSVLTQAEMGFGDNPKWMLLRGILMDAFGHQGVDGILNRLNTNQDGWCEDELLD